MLGRGSFGSVTAITSTTCQKDFIEPMAPSAFKQIVMLKSLRQGTSAHLVAPLQLWWNPQRRSFHLVFPRYAVDLHTRIVSKGPMQGDVFARLCHEVKAGVAYLHAHVRYASLDISPANVLLTLEGRAALTDFDLTRHVSWAPLPLDVVYCAPLRPPELFFNHVYLSPDDLVACDTWALGMTLDFANRGFYVVCDTKNVIEQLVAWWGPAPLEWTRYPGYVCTNVAPEVLPTPPDWPVYSDLLHLAPSRRGKLQCVGAATTIPAARLVPFRRLLLRLHVPLSLSGQAAREAHVVDMIHRVAQKQIHPGIAVNALVLLDIALYARPFDVYNKLLPMACLHLIGLQFDQVDLVLWEHELGVVARQAFCLLLVALAKLVEWEPPLGAASLLAVNRILMLHVAMYPRHGYRQLIATFASHLLM